jgi:hypothetical protein
MPVGLLYRLSQSCKLVNHAGLLTMQAGQPRRPGNQEGWSNKQHGVGTVRVGYVTIKRIGTCKDKDETAMIGHGTIRTRYETARIWDGAVRVGYGTVRVGYVTVKRIWNNQDKAWNSQHTTWNSQNYVWNSQHTTWSSKNYVWNSQNSTWNSPSRIWKIQDKVQTARIGQCKEQPKYSRTRNYTRHTR